MASEERTRRIAAAEEHAVFGKRTEVSGTVRVEKTTRTETQSVDGCLESQALEICRVPVERWVDGPVPVRQEGDVTIISLVEEVAVIEKRLRVFEEIHLTKTATTRQVHQQVPIRKQDIRVERTTVNDATPER